VSFFQLHFSRKQEVTAVDRAMNVVSILHPMTALPQVYSIYNTHNVSGISLLTWLLFMAIGAVFLAYGLVHKIKPLILLQVLWFIIDAAVVTGVILYR
jgi:uncharacterized protein with PQ loop repeat